MISNLNFDCKDVSFWGAKLATKLDLLEEKVESQAALISQLINSRFDEQQKELIKAIDKRIDQQRIAKQFISSPASPSTLLPQPISFQGNELNSSMVEPSNPAEVVYFCVQRNSEYSEQGTAIPFDQEEIVNVNSPVNLARGIFIVQEEGPYFFSLDAIAGINGTNVYLEVNGVVNATASANNNETLILRTILIVKKWDQVQLRLSTAAGLGSIQGFDRLGSSKSKLFLRFTGIQLNNEKIQLPSTIFFARRKASLFFSQAGTKQISFENELMNVGGAVNKTSGVFTVPRNGRYLLKFNSTSWNCGLQFCFGEGATVHLKLNGLKIASSSVESDKPISIQIVDKELQMGDNISVSLENGGINNNNYHSDFIGISSDHSKLEFQSSIDRLSPILLRDYPALSIANFWSHHNSFYVSRSSSYSPNYRSKIPFEVEMQNRGNAMNITTGIFTAPQSGDYYFSFSARTGRAASNTIVHLKLNDEIISSAFGSSEGQFISLHSIVTLKMGNQISIFLEKGSIYENNYYSQLTEFYGFLISN